MSYYSLLMGAGFGIIVVAVMAMIRHGLHGFLMACSMHVLML